MKPWHFLVAALICALKFPSLALSADAVHSADISKRSLEESDFPRWKELTPDVYAYEDTLGPMNGAIITTVSLIVVTTDGVVVVDGQNDVPQTQLMIDNLRKLTPQPIKYVVIASDHSDHVGGNSAFKAAYPRRCRRRRLRRTQIRQRRPSQTSERQVGQDRYPDLESGACAHWRRPRGLSAGKQSVVHGRNLFAPRVSGVTSAYPTEWTGVIRKAQAMDVSWYVPGHGFIDNAATMKRDLQESLKALEYVIAESKRLHAAGVSCESRTNCPAAQKAKWGAL